MMSTERNQPEVVINDVDGLDRCASDALLKALYYEQLLNPAAFFRAREILFSQRHWWCWVNRILLIIGSVLILAGVIFFFAYNWAEMSPFLKFALIEAAILGCAHGVWYCQLDTLAGKSCCIAAMILVGVFLAVFGQVYPTGADAYNLFGGWALLISAWVIISRSAGMWFLWILLWNLTTWFYWDHGRVRWIHWDVSSMALSLAGLNAAFLIFIEAGARMGWDCLRAQWLRGMLLIAVFGSLIYPIEAIVFSWSMTLPVETLLASLSALAATYYYYRCQKPDLFALAVGMFFICVTLSSVLIRVLIDKPIYRITSEPLAVLFAGMCIVGIFAAAVFTLRAVSHAMPAGASGDHAVAARMPIVVGADGKHARLEPLTMRMLLDGLQAENHINSSERDAISTVLFKSMNEKPTPWYLHAMVAFGAWLASLCFLSFVFLMLGNSFRNAGSMISMGLVWIGMAVFMSRIWETILFSQLALAMSAAGHGMLLAGVDDAVGYSAGRYVLAFVACLLCAVLNRFYRTVTHRFLSALLALALIYNSVTDRSEDIGFALCLVLAFEAGAVGFLFTHPKSPAHLRPVGFAAALVLSITFFMLMLNTLHHQYIWWSREYTWWLLNTTMVLMAAALTWHLTARSESLRNMRSLLFICSAVLGIFGGTGLLLGVALMALGYARREREITVFGIATLVTFLFFYYYNLQTDLMLKSLILGGSGGVLLLARVLAIRRMPSIAEVL